MPLLEQIANEMWLLLSAIEVTAHGGHHLGAIAGSALALGVRFDVLVEELIGIQLGTIARHLNQSDAAGVRGDKDLRAA